MTDDLLTGWRIADRTILRTFQYTAPEQIEGLEAGARVRDAVRHRPDTPLAFRLAARRHEQASRGNIIVPTIDHPITRSSDDPIAR